MLVLMIALLIYHRLKYLARQVLPRPTGRALLEAHERLDGLGQGSCW